MSNELFAMNPLEISRQDYPDDWIEQERQNKLTFDEKCAEIFKDWLAYE